MLINWVLVHLLSILVKLMNKRTIIWILFNYEISEIIPYLLMIYKVRLVTHYFVERQQKIPTISGPIFFIYAINATKLKYRWYHLRGFWPLPKPSRFLISKPHSSPNFTMGNEAKVLQLFLYKWNLHIWYSIIWYLIQFVSNRATLMILFLIKPFLKRWTNL